MLPQLEKEQLTEMDRAAVLLCYCDIVTLTIILDHFRVLYHCLKWVEGGNETFYLYHDINEFLFWSF